MKILVLLILILALIPRAWAAPADDVLIVVNNASADSIAVGKYYQERRNVPINQIVYINTTTGIDITCDNYFNQIELPVRTFLDANGLKSKILYIVTTYGIPYKGCYSVDSRLSDLYNVTEWQGYGTENPYRRIYYTTYSNGNHMGGVHFSNAYGIYLVTRLDGPTPEIAKGLIDKAMYAEKYLGTSATGYMAGQPYLVDSINVVCASITKSGRSCVSDSGHAGGPNAAWHNGGGNDYENVWNWMPGALAAHFQSFTASTTIRNTTGPKVVPAMLAAGVTATWGAVDEPYAPFVPQPVAYYDYFLNGGFNFAESMYMSTYLLEWMSVIIGDPLYTLPASASIDNEKPAIANASFVWDSNNLIVSWDNTHSNTGSPEITEGAVEYGLTASYGSIKWDTSNLTYWSATKRNYFSRHNITIAGLDSSKTYYVRINATDPAGNSETYAFSTDGAPANDTTPPTVTLTSPINSLMQKSKSVIFTCSATDNVAISNITLYGNWKGAWHANETKSTGSSASFSKTIADGSYIWNCLAYDNSSNSQFAASDYSCAIDSTPPALTFVPPTPVNNSVSNNLALISITASETLASAILEWNRTQNLTMANAGPKWSYMITSVPTGNCTFKVFANDTAGNWNATEERTFYLRQMYAHNFTIKDKFGKPIPDSIVSLYDKSGASIQNFKINLSAQSKVLDLDDTYSVAFSVPTGEMLYLNNINISANATLDPEFVNSSELPSLTQARSEIIAFNASGIVFDYAQITLPVNGTVNKILHCTDWEFTKASCNSWDSKDLSAYPYRLNATHIVFNVTVFDAYLGGYYEAPLDAPAPIVTGGGGGSFAAISASSITITPNNEITKIQVYLKTSISNALISATDLLSVPVPPPNGTVYRYFNISAKNFNDSIVNNVTIEFKVSKRYILEKNITSIYLSRYTGDKWIRLITELKEADREYNNYIAYSAGFSYFAIVEEMPVLQAAADPATPQPREVVKPNISSAPTEEIRIIAAEPPEKSSNSSTILASAGFFFITAICTIIRRNRSRKKEYAIKELKKKVEC
ncbi:MAG: TIGR03790 family protein [Nanoarchaeota archaeon]|nr:TIGR03790 family protein [Nanoarchaeota archaeon]MBU4451486.1 TIGR03790 family protein [Nanoarchaeota archaeon]MCG2723863.1 TIGR03790 family protein [archaeon]